MSAPKASAPRSVLAPARRIETEVTLLPPEEAPDAVEVDPLEFDPLEVEPVEVDDPPLDEFDDEPDENLIWSTVPPRGESTGQLGMVRPVLSLRSVVKRPQCCSTPP